MMDYYHYIKAFHLIFIITWFAGLFYIPRLFVYHIEANQKNNPEKSILCAQFKIMEKRLWQIITWPSALLATCFGLLLLYLQPTLLNQHWMQLKLAFVVLLIGYHLKTHQYYRQFQNDIILKTSNFMRLWNEGATFILFAVIFLVLLKSAFNWIFGIIALIILVGLIGLGYKMHQRIRNKNNP